LWMIGAEHDRRDEPSSRRSFYLVDCCNKAVKKLIIPSSTDAYDPAH
jgi:hypothetical protein